MSAKPQSPSPDSERYPPAPWTTHGRGVFIPYLVRASDLELPAGFHPVSVGGFCTGLLAYVVYEEPSPLTYNELIWMPALVSYRASSGRVYRGYYVSFMYVDDGTTLIAGREIWGLPKTRARFTPSEGSVQVSAEDGTELRVDYSRLTPLLPMKSRMATLQSGDAETIQFRAEMSGRAAVCRARASNFSSPESGWRSFASARRVGPLGVVLSRFKSLMREPVYLS